MRAFLLPALLLAAASAVLAQAPAADADAVLKSRADRAFEAADWPSAQALYVVLADREPEAPLNYARAIVAGECRGDSALSAEMVNRAMAAGLPLDSVLVKVENESYRLADGDMYPALLRRIAVQLPYLRRALQVRLLDHSVFRADHAATIATASDLLRGMPEDAAFAGMLGTLAHAYLMNGQDSLAMATYSRVLALEPDDYDALVALGNYYISSDPDKARDCLLRAYAVRPTPFVERLIQSLNR